MIIKPVLDMLGHFDVPTIALLSSATVFSMSATSLIKAIRIGVTIKWKVSSNLALGSIMGGIIGKSIFNYLIAYVNNDEFIGFIQSGMLALLLLIIFILVRNMKNLNAFHVQNPLMIFLVGSGLGVLSSFLGIGGGPLNVAVLYLVFSMNVKNTMINSIFIIFFSQLSTLFTVGLTTGFSIYDTSMLGYMIIGGILGGVIGTAAADKVSNNKVESIFNVTIILILFINVYNMIRYFI